MFDYLIVGAGLFGATIANLLSSSGNKVLVIERDKVVGGAVRTEWINNICVHKHGAHIFRTNDPAVWKYVTSFDEFIPFINSPLAIHNDSIYNLPFNMNTFARLWNIRTPKEARDIINSQIHDYNLTHEPKNLEEYAISKVGYDIYNCFIKEYTEKQWGKPCTDLSPTLMRRIPIRFTYDNNYYDNVFYQGIPKHGYSELIENLLATSMVLCGINGKEFIRNNPSIAGKIIYTGCIDEFYDYKFGILPYRSLTFQTEYFSDIDDFQGNAVVNYPDLSIPYTRSIEHKHFLRQKGCGTVVTKEYPCTYIPDKVYPYYPIESDVNSELYNKYLQLCDGNIVFCGRLGSYQYFDMDDTIKSAFSLYAKEEK